MCAEIELKIVRVSSEYGAFVLVDGAVAHPNKKNSLSQLQA